MRKEIVQTYNRLEMEGNDETKKENAVRKVISDDEWNSFKRWDRWLQED